MSSVQEEIELISENDIRALRLHPHLDADPKLSFVEEILSENILKLSCYRHSVELELFKPKPLRYYHTFPLKEAKISLHNIYRSGMLDPPFNSESTHFTPITLSDGLETIFDLENEDFYEKSEFASVFDFIMFISSVTEKMIITCNLALFRDKDTVWNILQSLVKQRKPTDLKIITDNIVPHDLKNHKELLPYLSIETHEFSSISEIEEFDRYCTGCSIGSLRLNLPFKYDMIDEDHYKQQLLQNLPPQIDVLTITNYSLFVNQSTDEDMDRFVYGYLFNSLSKKV